MLKQVIQVMLKRFNAKLIRIPSYALPVMPFDVFEHVLFKVMTESGVNFRFIQVGANDGVMSDKLAPLIRKYQITGCLVVPVPDVLERLQEMYLDQPQLTFRNYMVGPAGGTCEIFRFKRDAPVPPNFFDGLANQGSGDIIERAAAGGLLAYVEKVECSMRTFGDLLAELGYVNLDLLYVDTEGSNDRIVYEALDAGINPTVINFEWTKMSLPRHYALKMRLLDEGYRFIDVGTDTICVRQ